MKYDYDKINDRGHDVVFHERITILEKYGYRGFTISSGRMTPGGIEIEAENAPGLSLKAEGETKVEAYKKLIDFIDLSLDEA